MSADGTTSPLDAVAVTVIVPVRNDAANLTRCLQGLARSARAAEVIVVDDASDDDTAAVATAAGVGVLRLQSREGPARARNHGAEIARGRALFFVDADVVLHPDAIERVARALADGSGVDAVFGSYDLTPGCSNFLSQYKNLFHRYVHQQGSEDAWTFWSGCGAMRREVFLNSGGFSARYERPCIEDIELGMRLRMTGHRIFLDKLLQGTHLKRWTLWRLIRSDIIDRALPWGRLLVAGGALPNDLNLKFAQRFCAIIACLLFLTVLVGGYFRPMLLPLPIIALGMVAVADAASGRVRTSRAVCSIAGFILAAVSAWILYRAAMWGVVAGFFISTIVALNAKFYCHWIRLRGIGFALLVLPMHMLYFIYSSGSFAYVAAEKMFAVSHAPGIPAGLKRGQA